MSSHFFTFALIVHLALFEAGLSQQECQARVVLTSQRELREEIANALQGLPATSTNSPTADTAREGQIAARIENKLDTITKKLDNLERRMDMLHQLGLTPYRAASSCAQILETDPASLSGYYWVTNGTGHPHRVYCDMTRSCGGVTGGWMRVAYLNMTNSSHQCPSGLRQRNDSGVRTCAAYSDEPSCSSVLHRAHGIHYSSVCGRIHGFQSRSVDGFDVYSSARGSTLDSNYVDGVSLTHGEDSRKQHIWTFAARPCTSNAPPAFVSSDYFLDGVPFNNADPINLSNPLWDGEGCGTNTCCLQNNPPWFHKQLPRPTIDDIEMRVCRDQSRNDEDLAIGLIEIYVR